MKSINTQNVTFITESTLNCTTRKIIVLGQYYIGYKSANKLIKAT